MQKEVTEILPVLGSEKQTDDKGIVDSHDMGTKGTSNLVNAAVIEDTRSR
jgi:hypothetical protein